MALPGAADGKRFAYSEYSGAANTNTIRCQKTYIKEMEMRLKSLVAAGVGLTMLVAGAQAQNKYDPGASDTEIKIGNSMPYSGPVSPYGVMGRVEAAYFKMLNEKGGINGRKINFISYDDQYTPSKTIEVMRRLVEEDNVLATFTILGSAANGAVYRYMNAKKVPHLFIGVGAEKFNDPKANPWTVPMGPSYEAEGRLYGTQILKTKPDAKVAVLYQNDDFGKDLLKGLKHGLGEKAKAMIVGEVSFETSDPTVDSQIVQLKESGANVFLFFGTSRPAAQAIRKAYDLGWRPEQKYLTYVAAFVKNTFEPAGLEKSAGYMSMTALKDPVQARWENDPETIEYKEFIKKYAPSVDVSDGIAVSGYVHAQAIEHVLRSAGNNLTRENILKQATSFKNFRAKMLMPGITLNNSAQSYFPISQVQVVRFNGKELEPVGDVVPLK
jgi:branched-chain amino acid transport system substrate-binding protein